MIMRITVYSFSYRDGGPPICITRTDGGGYVFDVRCIPDPVVVRADLVRSGDSLGVQTFFDNETEMKDYLSHVKALMQHTVAAYRKRECECHRPPTTGAVLGYHTSITGPDPFWKAASGCPSGLVLIAACTAASTQPSASRTSFAKSRVSTVWICCTPIRTIGDAK